jgi:hypothetical protein
MTPRRVGLGVLFVAWLYGVPFLLGVGLIRRTTSPYMPTRVGAEAYGAVTDRWLTAGLVLNLAIPVVGVVLARLARERFWISHFAGAIAAAMLIFVAMAVVSSHATTALLGHVPASDEPPAAVTGCIQYSGGPSCPGG